MRNKYVKMLIFTIITVSVGFMLGATVAVINNNSQHKRSVLTPPPDKEIVDSKESEKDKSDKKDENLDKENENLAKDNKQKEEADAIVIEKPSNLEASEVTSTTVNLTWRAPESTEGLVSYTICKDATVIAEVPADTTSYLVEGLQTNAICSFRVASNYSNGESSKDTAVNVRTKK